MRHDKIRARRQTLVQSMGKPALPGEVTGTDMPRTGEGLEEARAIPFTLRHFCYCGRAPRKPQ